jgi:hypothetical protein
MNIGEEGAVDQISDASSGSCEAFPVEIPEFVPQVVADLARSAYADWQSSPEFKLTVIRITTHPKMESVWSYVEEKQKSTGRYLRPARMSLKDCQDPEKRQRFAKSLLFTTLLELANAQPRAILRGDLEKSQQEWKAIAQKLHKESERLAYLEEVGISPQGRAKILGSAAVVGFEISTEAGDNIIMERERGDLKAHAIAVAICKSCSFLFGDAWFTKTATMTSVLLDSEVSPRQVRHWWESRPSAVSDDFLGVLKAVWADHT